MEMFYPCYGLAEATLLVTAGKRGGAPEVRHVTQELAERNKLHYEGKSKSQPIPIVGCGKKLDEVELIIVDPELHVPCECYTVGEIWVRGPNVAKGNTTRLFIRSSSRTQLLSLPLKATMDNPKKRAKLSKQDQSKTTIAT